MDGLTLVAGIVLVLAAANVVPAWLLAWGLAGGDGEPATFVHGLLAAATAVAAPISVWLLLLRLPVGTRGLLVAAVVASAAGAMAWASTHPDGPWWPLWGVLVLVAIGLPLVLAGTVTARQVTWPQVAIAGVPAVSAGVATTMAWLGDGIDEEDWTTGVLAAATSLVAHPALLAWLATT